MRLGTVSLGQRRVVVAQRGQEAPVHDVSGLCDGDLRNLLTATAHLVHIDDLPVVDLSDTTWLPPVPNPRRILCIGFNYLDHAAESQRGTSGRPTVFTRFPSTFVGHQQPLVRPAASDTLDWEGEVVAVVGRGGRHIRRESAMQHVAGYSVMGENSVREYQLHSTQATAGKNWDRSGSWGPWLVTLDEFDAPPAVVTRLNGTEKQRGDLSKLAFDLPGIIAYVSTWTELEPGDVIATGTPAGIGHRETPPRYLQPGDELSIELVGHFSLVNPVVEDDGAHPADPYPAPEEILP